MLIERLGATVDAVETTKSNHCRIRVTYEGKSTSVIAACSPSDVRSMKNFLGHVKRWMREVSDVRHDQVQ